MPITTSNPRGSPCLCEFGECTRSISAYPVTMPSVRNVAIDNLKPLNKHDNVGALWENSVLAERLKCLHYQQTLASLYFWRTYTGAEIDIVEEREGGIYAYECKWSRPAGARAACPSRSWPPTQARRSRSSRGRATGRFWAHNRRCPGYRVIPGSRRMCAMRQKWLQCSGRVSLCYNGGGAKLRSGLSQGGAVWKAKRRHGITGPGMIGRFVLRWSICAWP